MASTHHDLVLFLSNPCQFCISSGLWWQHLITVSSALWLPACLIPTCIRTVSWVCVLHSFLLYMCPSNLILLFLTIVSTVSMLALARKSVFRCFSLTGTCKMICRQRITKLCYCFSCLAPGAHVSLPYNKGSQTAAICTVGFHSNT